MQKSSENSPSRFDLCFNKMIEHYNSYFKRKINKTQELQIRVQSQVSSQPVRELHHHLRIMEESERELREVDFQVENLVSVMKIMMIHQSSQTLSLLWQGPGQPVLYLQISLLIILKLWPSQPYGRISLSFKENGRKIECSDEWSNPQ